MVRDNIIPDHSMVTHTLDDVSTQTVINIEDLAILLHESRKKHKIKIVGEELYLNFDIPEFLKKKIIRLSSVNAFSELEKEGWIACAESAFLAQTGKADNVSGYPIRATLGKAQFEFTVNKFNKKYYLNCSSSPIRMVSGTNVYPIFTSDNPEEKAKMFCDLFCLSMFSLSEVIRRFYIKREEKIASRLVRAVKNKEIGIQRIQLAAYTPEFSSYSDMQRSLALLYNIYAAENIAAKYGGVSVTGNLGLKSETAKTEYIKNEVGQSVGVSGFLLRKLHAKNSILSFGFYDKNYVENLEVDQRINAIRLDLTLHRLGLERLSKHYCKETFSVINSGNLYRFLVAVFERDITGGDLFRYCLKEILQLDQFLAVPRYQWKRVFEELKRLGYYDLLENLKTNYSENSWNSLCKEFAKKEDPSRLAEKLRKASLTRDNGKMENGPGVDVKIPYPVYRLAYTSIKEMYTDPEALMDWYEGYDSNYDPVADSKEAMRDSRSIYSNLMLGETLSLPVN